jgi:hypothetical protein
MKINSKWFLRGVISLGIQKTVQFGNKQIRTCDPDYPALNVDLATSMDWIVDEISKLEN